MLPNVVLNISNNVQTSKDIFNSVQGNAAFCIWSSVSCVGACLSLMAAEVSTGTTDSYAVVVNLT